MHMIVRWLDFLCLAGGISWDGIIQRFCATEKSIYDGNPGLRNVPGIDQAIQA